jgi:hypothetical protein
MEFMILTAAQSRSEAMITVPPAVIRRKNVRIDHSRE